MSLDAESPARPASTAATVSVARVRRGSLAVLVLVVVEYGIGMYVNLYATIPGQTMGAAWGARSRTGRRRSAFTP
jgi:hypothetical protein